MFTAFIDSQNICLLRPNTLKLPQAVRYSVGWTDMIMTVTWSRTDDCPQEDLGSSLQGGRISGSQEWGEHRKNYRDQLGAGEWEEISWRSNYWKRGSVKQLQAREGVQNHRSPEEQRRGKWLDCQLKVFFLAEDWPDWVGQGLVPGAWKRDVWWVLTIQWSELSLKIEGYSR